MKRKRTSSPGVEPEKVESQKPLVPATLLADAKRAMESDRLAKPARCSVCGEECAPTSTEGLCWVCRRLKLSAWRDNDTQIPAQE